MMSLPPATAGSSAGSFDTNPPVPHAKGPSIAQILLPYWGSRDRWLALGLLAIVLGISFGGTYAYVYLNRLSGDITDAMIALDWPRLRPLLIASLLVGGVTVLLPLIATYVTGYLELRWRTWMTRRNLARWLRHAHYYQVERDGLVSNADQRIAEDLGSLANQSLTLFTSVVGVIVSVVTYTVVLWQASGSLALRVWGQDISVPGYMVFAAYAYIGLQLALSHWLGKHLIGLNIHRQTVEADFRYHGMQVREYAEQIAFYRGDAREREQLIGAFARIRHNTLAILARTFATMFGQGFYAHLLSMLPTLLVLPRLLSGQVTFGEMTTIVGAYGLLIGALTFFTQAYIGFTNWLAITNRVRDLQWGLDKAERQASGVQYLIREDDRLQAFDLRLDTPLGQPLMHLASWTVARGDRWLSKGASGTGKSTLLRSCAGLWPYGRGCLGIPGKERSLFLPQKSYIPAGTLREAMAYPQRGDAFTDASYAQALRDVQLDRLVDSLSVSDRWQQILSGGEQQRIAFARVLLQRPDYVFLDEATSALDLDSEGTLYRALIEQLPRSTLISVAHRPSVDAFHSHLLELGGTLGSSQARTQR